MASINHELHEPTYDNVVVDEPIGPGTITAAEAYRIAGAPVSPWMTTVRATWRRTRPGCPRRCLVAQFCSVYDLSRTVGLHQKEEIWFINPVPLNAKYTDKYMKRGKGYTVFDTDAHDADSGVHYVCARSVPRLCASPMTFSLVPARRQKRRGRIIFVPYGRQKSRRLPTRGRIWRRGDPVQPLQKRPEQWQMTVFSGGNTQWYNIHTYIEVALSSKPDSAPPWHSA